MNASNMTIYDLSTIVELFSQQSGHKAYLDDKFKTEYIIGNVTEQDLIDFGFTKTSISNKCGVYTPIYRYGNIEAIYVEQLVHMYTIA